MHLPSSPGYQPRVKAYLVVEIDPATLAVSSVMTTSEWPLTTLVQSPIYACVGEQWGADYHDARERLLAWLGSYAHRGRYQAMIDLLRRHDAERSYSPGHVVAASAPTRR